MKKTDNNSLNTMLRIVKFLKYQKLMFIIGTMLLIFSAFFTVANNLVLKTVLDEMTKTNWEVFKNAGIILILLIVGNIVTEYLGTLIIANMAQKVTYKIRNDVFKQIQNLSIAYLDTRKDGDLMSIFINDIELLCTTLDQSISKIIIAIVLFIGTIIGMFYLNSVLAIINLFIYVVIIILAMIIMNKNIKLFEQKQKNKADITGYVSENFYGKKVINIFNQEEKEKEKFSIMSKDLEKISIRSSISSKMLGVVVDEFSGVASVITMIIGVILAFNGNITIGTLVPFITLTDMLKKVITILKAQIPNIMNSIAGANRVFEILDQDEEYEDKRNLMIYKIKNYGGIKFWENQVTKEKVPVKGMVEFKNVDFSYQDKKVLSDISFYAKPGSTIAIVGSTGAGKTTIVNLISRFYEIDNGKITIDGIDIKNIYLSDLRGLISMVLQDIQLFDGTITDNIKYGNLKVTNSEIKNAITLVGAEFLINKLEKGLDTEILENSKMLSEGEKQMISITRAAIADSSILVLDEATSAIDTIMEKRINKGIDRIINEKTTIVIAHRLSTVRNADCILLIENGKIVEKGTHEELMALKQKYYKLNNGEMVLT